MSEKNSPKQDNAYDQPRVFNAELTRMPILKSGIKKGNNADFSEQELEAMCKNPRESAELIRYLIEFIKSL